MGCFAQATWQTPLSRFLCQVFTGELIKAFHRYIGQMPANMTTCSKNLGVDALIKIVDHSQELCETIIDAQLPLMANLTLPFQSSTKLAAQVVHTTNSSNLLETLTRKVQPLTND